MEEQPISHFAGRVADLRHLSVQAERAPAFDVTVIEQRARGVASRHELSGRPTSAEVHGGQRIAHFSERFAATASVAVPELTASVIPPALDAVVLEQRARVCDPERDIGRVPGRVAARSQRTGRLSRARTTRPSIGAQRD